MFHLDACVDAPIVQFQFVLHFLFNTFSYPLLYIVTLRGRSLHRFNVFFGLNSVIVLDVYSKDG